MAQNNTALIDSVVTCPICLEHFDDPRILNCSHTYCFRCIQKIASNNNGQFVCPLRDGTVIETNDINSLPSNRVVREIVELLGQYTHKFLFYTRQEIRLSESVGTCRYPIRILKPRHFPTSDAFLSDRIEWFRPG